MPNFPNKVTRNINVTIYQISDRPLNNECYFFGPIPKTGCYFLKLFKVNFSSLLNFMPRTRNNGFISK